MSRPSRALDRRMIAAARAMLPETGFSGLQVRAVVRRAGVNLGMFHYHFKSRRAFLRRVLGEVYEDFLVSFRDAAREPGAPRARLRRVLVAYAHFARRHRVFYTLMLRELLNGQRDMAAFARAHFPRHMEALLGLIEECRREGSLRPWPAPMLAMFAMSSMGLPNVAATGLERNGVRQVGGVPRRRFVDRLLDDRTIEDRADMVLAALAAPRRRA